MTLAKETKKNLSFVIFHFSFRALKRTSGPAVAPGAGNKWKMEVVN
jgi:hypothetical protein